MSNQTRRDAWIWLRRLLGVGPLAVFAVFHLWVHWPALFGREAWLERAAAYGPGIAIGVLVVALLALHALLGLTQKASPPGGAEDVRANGRSWQTLTGVLLGLFVIYHLTHVWPRPDGVHATLERSYQRLWDLLGKPAVLGSYVLGCGVLTCHLTLGVLSLLEPRAPGVGRTVLRFAVGTLGLALFVSYLQLIARFAVGEGILPLASL